MKLRFAACLIFSALTVLAQAQDPVLIVDLSVVDQVTISATDAPSAVTATGPDGVGVYLADIFGGSSSTTFDDTLVSGDITNFLNPSDGSPLLFRGDSGNDPGLNLWTFSSDVDVDFVAGTQAFTGSGTWDIDSVSYSELLSGPSTGNVLFPADTVDDGGEILGSYSVVVPEPSSIALVGIGLLGLGLVRRR